VGSCRAPRVGTAFYVVPLKQNCRILGTFLGVPNAQLINEGSHVASAYKNKSVAEQNSLEISWNLLMEPCYRNLREALFANSDELMHFRSLVVTATLATDIADKELAAMRKDRAAEALAVLDEEGPTSDDIASLKATFVLETLIQVADVSHLMMPFEVYKKWNYKLLRETHQAFLCGRAESDPLDSWYQGEFGFFDFYIIPLAKKLDKCGIDSSFYVENATNNRKRWGEIGEDLVNGFRKTLKSEGRSKIGASFDDSSSSESDFDGDSFGEDVESNSDSNSTSESSDDDKKESKPLRTLFRIPPIPTMRRMREIQRQKTEQYNHRVTKSNQQKACPERALSGGNEHVGPVRRIVYKRKTSSREPSPTKDERKGRSKTAVPDGERRYKQRSKSASSEPNGVEVKSDDEYHNPRSVTCRRKKKARSRSLENSKGQKKSMKGKRPEKTKVEEV
jgi:3'5'-cyclic nucleotide phosphodiesterase